MTILAASKCLFGRSHVQADRANGSSYCVECLLELGELAPTHEEQIEECEAEVDTELEEILVQCEECGADRMELSGNGGLCDVCEEREKRLAKKLAERGLS